MEYSPLSFYALSISDERKLIVLNHQKVDLEISSQECFLKDFQILDEMIEAYYLIFEIPHWVEKINQDFVHHLHKSKLGHYFIMNLKISNLVYCKS